MRDRGGATMEEVTINVGGAADPFARRVLRSFSAGVHGTLLIPTGAAPIAGVLVIGGSGGSEPTYVAEGLALEGFAALSIAHTPRSRHRDRRVAYADRLPVIDLAAVAHAKDEDNELVAVDLVHDPVVAGTDPPLARATDEPGRGWWPGIDSEQLNGGLEASPHIRVELAELARG